MADVPLLSSLAPAPAKRSAAEAQSIMMISAGEANGSLSNFCADLGWAWPAASGSMKCMTGNGDAPPSALARIRNRQEMRLAAALWRADRPMAVSWWGLLTARGLLPAGFAIATGVLVAAVERGSGLAAPLLAVAVVFILMQVLGPLHTALSANLGDRTAAWLYDELTGACVAPWASVTWKTPCSPPTCRWRGTSTGA